MFVCSRTALFQTISVAVGSSSSNLPSCRCRSFPATCGPAPWRWLGGSWLELKAGVKLGHDGTTTRNYHPASRLLELGFRQKSAKTRFCTGDGYDVKSVQDALDTQTIKGCEHKARANSSYAGFLRQSEEEMLQRVRMVEVRRSDAHLSSNSHHNGRAVVNSNKVQV